MRSERRVRRVRLRAPADALVRRGATLLEDAMRTASFEATAGEIVVVRRFDVGRIDPAESPGALSLRIERRLRALRRRVVAADAAEGPAGAAALLAADAVVFRDAVEPLVHVVERLAAARMPLPWFLRLAVPRATGDARAILSEVLVSAAAIGPHGPVALVSRLVSRGASAALGHLLEAIDPGATAPLMAAIGASSAPSERARPRGPQGEEPELDDAEPSAAPALVAALTTAARRWGASDGRVVWLAAIALLQHAPIRRADPMLVNHARALAARLAERTAAPRARPPSTTAPGSLLAGEPLEAAARRRGSEPAVTPGEERSDPPRARAERRIADPDVSRSDSRSRAAGEHAPARAPEPRPTATRTADALERDGAPRFELQPTEVGGLLFLVAVLERVGVAELVARHPEACLAQRVLVDVARRLGAAPDDPLVAALDHDLALLDVDGAFAETAAVVTALRRAVRRWVRRAARMGLHALVRRPARATCTATHIDVVFDLARADLRVRRAGLDIDPGWVPWLGRVISFHYWRGAHD
jgi:hypothetical protein